MVIEPKRTNEVARKGGWSKISPEDRSKIAKNIWANISPERRSEIRRNAWARMSPEKRSEIRRKALASMSSEERSESIRKGKTTLGHERMSEIGRIREANKSLDEKNRRATKISESTRARWDRMSTEERSAIIKKGWETRKKEVERKLAIISIDDLPNLKLLTKIEETKLLKLYFEHFFENKAKSENIELTTLPISWFSRRTDYEDAQQEFRIAILNALRKWDKKMDLDKLVNNSVVEHMYRYFAGEKKYESLMAQLNPEIAELITNNKTNRKKRNTN